MGGARGVAQNPRAGPRASIRPGHLSSDGRAWPPGMFGPAGIRRRRHGLHQPRHRQRGARIRRHVVARDHVGARRAQLPVAPDLGHRGPEAALPRAAGAGQEDRDLRPDRTGRRQRRPRHSDHRDQEGGSLSRDRREDVDLAGRRRGQLPRLCLDGPGQEATARHLRDQRLHHRTQLQGIHQRDTQREVGDPGGQYRLLQDGGRRSAC